MTKFDLPTTATVEDHKRHLMALRMNGRITAHEYLDRLDRLTARGVPRAPFPLHRLRFWRRFRHA